MSMEDWAKYLDGFIEFNGNEILTGTGKINTEKIVLQGFGKVVGDLLIRGNFHSKGVRGVKLTKKFTPSVCYGSNFAM